MPEDEQGKAFTSTLDEMTIDELKALISKAQARIEVRHRRDAAIRNEIARQAKVSGLSKEESEFLFGAA